MKLISDCGKEKKKQQQNEWQIGRDWEGKENIKRNHKLGF